MLLYFSHLHISTASDPGSSSVNAAPRKAAASPTWFRKRDETMNLTVAIYEPVFSNLEMRQTPTRLLPKSSIDISVYPRTMQSFPMYTIKLGEHVL